MNKEKTKNKYLGENIGLVFVGSTSFVFGLLLIRNSEIIFSIFLFLMSLLLFLSVNGFIFKKINHYVIKPLILKVKQSKPYLYLKKKDKKVTEKNQQEKNSGKYLFSNIKQSSLGSFIVILISLLFLGIILFKSVKDLDIYVYEYVVLGISILLTLPMYLGFEDIEKLTKFQYKYYLITNRILKFIGYLFKFILIGFLLYKFFSLPSKTIIIILLIMILLDKRF